MDIQKKIPISREILADMETPLSVYRKLANCSYSYLFESVEGGDKWARYSLIGLKARRLIKVIKNEVVILQDGRQIETITADDPLDYLDQLQKSYTLEEDRNLPSLKINKANIEFKDINFSYPTSDVAAIENINIKFKCKYKDKCK